MGKFIIEVPHDNDRASRMKRAKVFYATGSHFVTHAEWGCRDGNHKAWLIVEVEDKHEAMRILPSFFQRSAKITKISKFTREDMDEPISNFQH